MPGGGAFKKAAPELAARIALWQKALGGEAIGIRKAKHAAKRRRQHLVDAGADALRKNRARALRTDSDGQRRAGDKGGRVEIAEIRLVNSVCEYTQCAGRRDNSAIRRAVASRAKDHDSADKKFRAECRLDMFNSALFNKGREVG